MAKKIKTVIKLQVVGGKANPAPPIGPVLGQHGLAIQEFCMRFNDATKDKVGEVVPVEITVYEDRSFDFIMKTAPAAELLKKASNAEVLGRVIRARARTQVLREEAPKAPKALMAFQARLAKLERKLIAMPSTVSST